MPWLHSLAVRLRAHLFPGVSSRPAGRPLGLEVLEDRLAPATLPGDPAFAGGLQWGLNGAYGINAPQAWDAATGNGKVTVAVLDTGIDYNHPDLYQNVWLNQAEVPASRLGNLRDVDGDGRITFRDLNNPVNQGAFKITDVNRDGRIDAGDILAPMQKDSQGRDTGNGGWADGISQDGDTAHVDDLVGWNFLSNTNDPSDGNGHGTHVAGILGAVGNNDQGVSGVNWQVPVMALKCFDTNSAVGPDTIAAALQYAARHGARVSNNSYAGEDSPTLKAALDQLATWDYGPGQGKGMVFVAAAGNFATNTDSSPVYPASYPQSNILSVAATDVNGKLAAFSDYGATTVDVAAPGVDVYSTTPGKSYGWNIGTSMASPFGAGVAALLLAQNPTWNADQVVSRIIATATPSAALAGKMVSGGILNAGAALASGSPSTAPSTGASQAVNLSGSYNRLGLANDGQPFSSSGGIDSSGHALSAGLLGGSLTWNGTTFTLAAGNTNNVVAALGQAITLPAGNYSSLSLLATAAWGSYANQRITVTYTDGSSQTFFQSFSEWVSPQGFAGESIAATMPYRDNANGTKDPSRPVYVYGYSFALNAGKTVKSITLPAQGKINVLAITLSSPATTTTTTTSTSAPLLPPKQVYLGGAANRMGLANDGQPFSSSAGIDGAGHALSAGLLGPNLSWNGLNFALGVGGSNNVVSAAGQTIALPVGRYAVLSVIAAAVNGPQVNQVFTVTYSDGSTQSFTQSISDWTAPQGFDGESIAASLAYSDNADGSTTASHPADVYGYRFALDAGKAVRSITLPGNGNDIILAMTLQSAAPTPTPVVLDAAFNQSGIARDGVPFRGGLDGAGHAYSNSRLRSFVAYNGLSFGLGSPGSTNVPDTVSAAGQVIALPAGRYSVLSLIAAAANGSQVNQDFTVTYTDGTSQTFTQSISDWITPQNFAGESIVATMSAFDNADATTSSSHPANVYGYRFALDAGKQVKSLTLPGNGNVVLLAAALQAAAPAGPAVDLNWNGGGLTVSAAVRPGTTTTLPRSYLISGGTAGSDFTISYYASTDGAFGNADDVLLGSETVSAAAGKTPGPHSGTSPSLTIPTGAQYLFARLDAGNAVSEADETNNVASATLAPAVGTAVNLLGSYNRLGLANDGQPFSSSGGIDSSGHALSAGLLGGSLTWNGTTFTLAAGNTNNVVAALGQTITLPAGSYSSLSLLATAAWGSYANQRITVTYTDGSSQTFFQSFSDWTAPQRFAGESIAATMPYRDNANGSTDGAQPVYVYGYSFALNAGKTVKSITLPAQGKINVLAITLS